MTHAPMARRDFLRALTATGASCLAGSVLAVEPAARPALREPVHRVAKVEGPAVPVADTHALDPVLAMARETLAYIQQNVDDYTALVVKRERIGGKLGDYEYMESKVRNRKLQDGKIVVPLSAYLKFVKPKNIAGREVVWVEGENGNKLRAHEGGFLGKTLPSVWLDPHGAMAMRGNLHPITDIGIENLVTKLIEKGERERQYGECEVKFIPGATINKRVCTVLQVVHPVPRQEFEFHMAQIFIDDEMKLPIRYAAYLWPTSPDMKAPHPDLVIEEYTYLNLKINQGLTDRDFDSSNPNYNF
jgi:hypothetical protein